MPSAFLFHGPSHSRPDPEPLPLADLISANLDHYRLDADYKHGLHFTALPTAWVSGFDSSTPLRIGASTAWVSEVPGASAGFLEFSGAGLAYLERALERSEQRMTSLAARLLEPRSATDDSSRRASSCGLAAIVASVNHSLTKVLRASASLLPDPPSPESISFAMNTDLLSGPLPAADVAALVQAWKAGAISRDSLLEKLRKGDILPDGRSIAEERAMIHGVGRKAFE